MFSRPVSSGWKPVPTSSNEPTRPRTLTVPSVGSVTRDRILSNVLFPAPLRPTMPRTLPSSRSKETSFNAQMKLLFLEEEPLFDFPARDLANRIGALSESTITSRSIPYRNLVCAAPILYRLLRFFTLIDVVIVYMYRAERSVVKSKREQTEYLKFD